MTQVVISTEAVDSYLQGFRNRFFEKAVAKLQVLQRQQVAEAFKRQGQPGASWRKLWADSFVGKVPEKQVEAVRKAASAVVRAKTEASERKAIQRLQKADRKMKAATSYRKGGMILQDTGELRANWYNAPPQVYDTFAAVTLASTMPIAKWHQQGFRTRGPNCIPLTIAFKIGHVRGVNPEDEGFEEGVDYVMAWGGVTVPARPMIDYGDTANKAEINQALQDAAREAARG